MDKNSIHRRSVIPECEPFKLPQHRYAPYISRLMNLKSQIDSTFFCKSFFAFKRDTASNLKKTSQHHRLRIVVEAIVVDGNSSSSNSDRSHRNSCRISSSSYTINIWLGKEKRIWPDSPIMEATIFTSSFH